MFSTLTERGGRATLDALNRGASDYVAKPANVGKVSSSRSAVRDELLAKIKALCPQAPSKPAMAQRSAAPALPSSENPKSIDVVGIGVSTGGPNALATVLSALPPTFPLPILIVQHMPPMFTRLLSERLTAQGHLLVREGVDEEVIRPGHIYIAPGDFHMEVKGTTSSPRLSLQQSPPENSCRPAVDVLFRSMPRVFGGRILGVILTGMGYDGTRGAEHIKNGGGSIIVQDEATSVVWGMPGGVVGRGLAEKILPLPEIAKEIIRRAAVGRGPSASPTPGGP